MQTELLQTALRCAGGPGGKAVNVDNLQVCADFFCRVGGMLEEEEEEEEGKRSCFTFVNMGNNCPNLN